MCSNQGPMSAKSRVFSRRPSPAALLVAAVAAAPSAAAFGGGCNRPEDTFVLIPTGSGPSSGEGGGGGATGLTAEEFFEQFVKQDMVESCSGVDCHSSGTVAFLLTGNEYASISTYKSTVGLPLLVEDPSTSLLIRYPNDPEHPGRRWDGIELLRDKVFDWLGMEALNIDPDLLLQVGPIKPDGLTVVSLAGLGPDLTGATMTFYATEVGTPVTSLLLSNISVWPPNGRGVRMVDPTFVVAPSGGAELANTSLHGDAYTFVAPNAVVLASGELVLTDWEVGADLYIRFDAIKGLFADADGNTFEPCSRVDLFREAVDALPKQPASNAPNGLLYCADQCHGGTKGAQPTTTMSIAELLTTPPGDEVACGKVRLFITPSNAAGSRIVTVTDPQGSEPHPFVFGGNSTSHAAFRDAMAPWIEQEGAVQ